MLKRGEIEDKLRIKLGLESTYYHNVKESVFDGIDESLYWEGFWQGRGSEFKSNPPKACSIASSAVLAINSFAPFKNHIRDLVVGKHRGFNSINFEQEVNNGLKGTHPQLDIMLNGEVVRLAIESKFLEPIEHSHGHFSEQYLEISDHRSGLKWFRALKEIHEGRLHFKYLDATQLLKHLTALCYKENDNYKLGYIYWEPVNWKEVAEYSDHRREILTFSKYMSPGHFFSMSYDELWEDWRKLGLDWLDRHVYQLRERYDLRI